MNQLQGTIQHIKRQDALTELTVEIDHTKLYALYINSEPENKMYALGGTVNLLFKETEVILLEKKEVSISIDNLLDCTITSIEMGEILSNVILDFNGKGLTAIIPSNACSHFYEKQKVFAIVKSNEIMLSV